MPERDPVGLVLEICHEVGNHLAAARLSAHWAGRQPGRAEIGEATRAIETVAAEAAALLAQVRPLLVESATQRVRLSPREAVEAVEREVESLPGETRRLVTRVPVALPDVEVDPGILHATLLSLVLSARTRSRAAVRLSVAKRGRSVCFRVEEPAPRARRGATRGAASRSRDLVVAVADHALRSAGGRAVVRKEGARVGAELRLPARSPRRVGRSA